MRLPNFEEITLGMSLGECEYRLTPGRILKYVEGTEDQYFWYEQGSPCRDLRAPPTICDNDNLLLPGFKSVILGSGSEGRSEDRRMFMHTKVEFEFLCPAKPGELIRVTGKVVDKYEKRRRQWVIVETLSAGEDGRPILRSYCTYCWLVPRET